MKKKQVSAIESSLRALGKNVYLSCKRMVSLKQFALLDDPMCSGEGRVPLASLRRFLLSSQVAIFHSYLNTNLLKLEPAC